MTKTYIAAFAATLLAGSAFAADLPNRKEPIPVPVAVASGFDFAFGGKLMTDYISRGITQSNHKPAFTAYGEGRYNLGDTQLYAGVQGWSVKLPSAPAAEVDLYGGVRQTWGSFSADLGAIYYWYPNNTNQYWTDGASTVLNPSAFFVNNFGCQVIGGTFCATTARDPSFLEIYLKPSYAVTDAFNVGANLYYSPNWNNYHFDEFYLSGTAKYTFGTSGFSVSGELGHEWLGSTKAGSTYGVVKFPDYWTWNVGVSYAWKVLTADLRYSGTDLNKSKCYLVTSDPGGNQPGFNLNSNRSNWCGQRIMATLSFDLSTAKDLK